MFEHRISYDLATQLLGLIQCVVADEIRPAIEYLEGAARVTAKDLIREFGQRWGRWFHP
jgi:hypothetical protein